jgi:hypothetical protein
MRWWWWWWWWWWRRRRRGGQRGRGLGARRREAGVRRKGGRPAGGTRRGGDGQMEIGAWRESGMVWRGGLLESNSRRPKRVAFESEHVACASICLQLKKKTQTNIVLTVTINGSRVIYYNERIKAYSFNAREKRNGRVECFCSCAECFSYSVECFSDSAECFCSSVCSCRVESSRDEASRLCGAVGRTDGRMNGGDVLGGASFCC